MLKVGPLLYLHEYFLLRFLLGRSEDSITATSVVVVLLLDARYGQIEQQPTAPWPGG